jgi:membrane protein YqaA with SNARE-associated domain
MSNQTDIVAEAFLARLVPIFHEVTLGAIRHFQFENYAPNAALAALGGLAAAAVLYAIGVWLRRMPERVSTDAQQVKIEKLRAVAHEWLPWLLVLAPTPVGGVLVMAAGFFRLNPRLAWAVILLSEMVFRAMPYVR